MTRTRILSESLNADRQPGWERLGTKVAGLTATQAFQTLGQYDVALAPLYADLDGERFTTGHRAIFRHPTPDSPKYIQFGVVGPGYEIITPYDLATALDYALGEQPVSVIGAPKGGELFYVGYDLPEYEVRGDNMRNTLLISSPYDGKASLRITQFALRLVCTNGLTATVATESYALRHGANVAKTLARWVEGLWPRSVERSEELRAAFEQMTRRRLAEREAERMIAALLPIPKAPKATPDAGTNDKRMQDWHYRVERVQKDRHGVARLYAGEGQGMDTPAAAGTAWGFYNAVAEYYDHGKDMRNRDRGVAEALFGQAAEIKARAFEMALSDR